MDMKTNTSTTQSGYHPDTAGYGNHDYINMSLNCAENYMNCTSSKDSNDTNFFNENSKTLSISDDQNTDMSNYTTFASPYYNYKPNMRDVDHSAMNPQANDMIPQNSVQAVGSSYTTSNICPTTGYEAIPMAANPTIPCSCAYCIAYFQNQWYMNYYNSLAQSTYIIPSQSDPNSQSGKPFEYAYRPILLMKTNEAVYTNCQEQQEIDQKLAHLTPIYINQPVPSNTEHFQRRTPFKKRDHNALSWLLLYLELEKDVESPTMNARIAWINDMHHIIYTKLTSGIISRWQYEYEFSHLRNLITQKSMECDDIFKTFPRLCHCGERFKNENDFNDHSNHCVELKVPWHRCLCGKLFDQHSEYFQHIFSGIIICPMAVYNLWIFFEKYRRRRYKCFCSVVFHNFWVYYVHMGECMEYQNYFQRNCYFCQDSVKKNTINNSFWSYPMVGPLKDLVLHSKIQ